MHERVADEIENLFVYPDGETGWFELRVEPVPEGLMILSLDITERKSLEAQFRHAQKMEAVGRLAGGVAHDFNNILTAILSFAHFAAETIDPHSPASDDIAQVIKAGKRAEVLVRQLLAFSRKQAVEPRVLDVNHLVGDLEVMLRRILGEDVELLSSYANGTWPVRIDAGAFEQVLVNMAVNARDAMPTGGRLTIETANISLRDRYETVQGGVAEPGDYVLLTVTDNGSGMDAETVEQLFEPFFTTKEKGEGTGLGLSTCYGIVKQAGGFIRVSSEPAHGTTFRIYLPRVAERAEPEPVEEEDLACLSGSGTVVVVEDDPQVRSLAVRSLDRFGYKVIAAERGEDALVLCQAYAGKIDLLVTDVVMPGMNGKELAERMRRLCRDLEVVYVSGYAERSIVERGGVDPDGPLIQKPFTPQQLGRMVRDVLRRK